jgi:hypothetical protein
MMAIFLAFLLSATAEEACVEEDRSCGVGAALASGGAVAGSAMLQLGKEESKEDKESHQAQNKAKDAPMKGRLDTLDKEISSLMDRVATLEGEVGVSGEEIGGVGGGDLALATARKAPAAPAEEDEEAVLLSTATSIRKDVDDDDGDDDGSDSGDDTADEESLLEYGGRAASHKTGSIKDRMASAEAEIATLKSKVSVLENQVVGASGDSLLQKAGQRKGSNLMGRLKSLESETNMLRTQVGNLEHMVSG